MTWTVQYTNKAAKQYKQLPQSIRDIIDLLVMEIRLTGPVRSNWRNYSKLRGRKGQHHCHVKSGRPTYVVVWEESDNEVKLVEVIYAGTHEKAPY
jgi:mRNA-degrading endonuclease RelE of RelBE toxin-antitoxin system